MNGHLDEHALQELLVARRIWQCQMRYNRGVDRMDLELMRSAFWPDAVIAHGPVSGGIEEMIEAWFPAQARRELSWHMSSNQQVDFDEDPKTAHAETYFHGAFRYVGESSLEVVGGRYADRYEERDLQWRIVSRVTLLDWQGMADASGMTERLSTRHRGSRGTDDPTYERPLRTRAAVGARW